MVVCTPRTRPAAAAGAVLAVFSLLLVPFLASAATEVTGIVTPGSAQYPNGRMRSTANTILDSTSSVACGVTDTANGYAYVASYTIPPRVSKFALGRNGAPPRYIGSIELTAPDSPGIPAPISVALFDPGSGYAYFASNGTTVTPIGGGTAAGPSSAFVFKVALGAGDALPRQASHVRFAADLGGIISGVIDAATGTAWFGTTNYATINIFAGVQTTERYPAKILQVALNSGDAAPSLTQTITLQEGETDLSAALREPASNTALFCTRTLPGRVVKINLATLSRVGAAELLAGEDIVSAAALDPFTGDAIFGTGTQPGKLVRVAWGASSAAPTRISAHTLQSGQGYVQAITFDSSRRYAIVGCATVPGTVVKLAVGATPTVWTTAGALTLPVGADQPNVQLADLADSAVYPVSSLQTARVDRVGLEEGQRGALRATRLTMPTIGVVKAVRFYSRIATGNVRLALYDDATPRNLLWQSGSIPNTATNTELEVPVTLGSPAFVQIRAGTFWLAWQVDSTADVPAYLQGAAGNGFTYPMTYGPAPATLAHAATVSTDETWTGSVLYAPPGASGWVMK